MNSFDFYSPTEVLFGPGTHRQTGAYIRKYHGTCVLIVYGGERVIKTSLMAEITSSIQKEGLRYALLGGVVPNPHLDKVYEGIALGRQMQADFLLAVGGGSVIDTAKAIAYGLAEPDRDVWELFAHTRRANACLPVASVLTIAAAGSETSMGAVITNERTREKRAYDDDLARPKFAVMNPELTLSLSDYQTQSGCVDIMMHTMERYFTADRRGWHPRGRILFPAHRHADVAGRAWRPAHRRADHRDGRRLRPRNRRQLRQRKEADAGGHDRNL